MEPDPPRRAGLMGRPFKEASSQVMSKLSPSALSAAEAGSLGSRLTFDGFMGVTSKGLGAVVTFEESKTSGFASKGLRGSQESHPMIQRTQLDIPS